MYATTTVDHQPLPERRAITAKDGRVSLHLGPLYLSFTAEEARIVSEMLHRGAAQSELSEPARVAKANECDHCFKVAELYHNDATGLALCEDCDLKVEQGKAELRAGTQ